MRSLIYIERVFNRIGDALGWLSSMLFILLIANVVYDVVMRYAFNDVSIAFQEMEWHLFSAVFLLGVPYAIKAGGHVRVDVFYEQLSFKAQAIIDLLGTLIFLLPFCLLVAWFKTSLPMLMRHTVIVALNLRTAHTMQQRKPSP